MHIEVFRYRVNPDFKDEFTTLYAQMQQCIQSIDGYIGHKVFTADDGEKVLIGYFEHADAIAQWDVHPEHKQAKARGRDAVFAHYDVIVAHVEERHRSESAPAIETPLA
ncbi:antibiotic biosynthesis monooxygenase family protein [Vibrio parahaemolyticus]|uniref:antibiotic biosynthesis monooxygenase family protein n=1 Tax=Vibrio parahaemolyticus TaxID=670 RepID=UPI003AAC4DF9